MKLASAELNKSSGHMCMQTEIVGGQYHVRSLTTIIAAGMLFLWF